MLRLGLIAGAALALLGATLDAFPAFLAVMAGIAVALSTVPSMMDSYAVTASDRAGRSYGALRVWGSLGYTLAVLAIGRVMGDRVSALVLVGYPRCSCLRCCDRRLPRSPSGGPSPLRRHRDVSATALRCCVVAF